MQHKNNPSADYPYGNLNQVILFQDENIKKEMSDQASTDRMFD
jgi:hypothetical protein